MTSTHEKVSHLPASERHEHTPLSAAYGIEQALKFVEGRWKLLILFHLFGGKVLRFQVPPKVEYCLTTWGQSLCPALDALLKWAEMRSPGAPGAGA